MSNNTGTHGAYLPCRRGYQVSVRNTISTHEVHLKFPSGMILVLVWCAVVSIRLFIIRGENFIHFSVNKLNILMGILYFTGTVDLPHGH